MSRVEEEEEEDQTNNFYRCILETDNISLLVSQVN